MVAVGFSGEVGHCGLVHREIRLTVTMGFKPHVVTVGRRPARRSAQVEVTGRDGNQLPVKFARCVGQLQCV
ncbi:protein of unknown function [Paraburkholderia kururiensis]